MANQRIQETIIPDSTKANYREMIKLIDSYNNTLKGKLVRVMGDTGFIGLGKFDSIDDYGRVHYTDVYSVNQKRFDSKAELPLNFYLTTEATLKDKAKYFVARCKDSVFLGIFKDICPKELLSDEPQE